MIQDRTSVFPKAFTELTFGLSDVLKVASFTFHQVYKIFGLARYGVGDFSSFVGCKKRIVCLTLSKEITGKAAWVVAYISLATLVITSCTSLKSLLLSKYKNAYFDARAVIVT